MWTLLTRHAPDDRFTGDLNATEASAQPHSCFDQKAEALGTEPMNFVEHLQTGSSALKNGRDMLTFWPSQSVELLILRQMQSKCCAMVL